MQCPNIDSYRPLTIDILKMHTKLCQNHATVSLLWWTSALEMVEKNVGALEGHGAGGCGGGGDGEGGKISSFSQTTFHIQLWCLCCTPLKGEKYIFIKEKD